MSMRHLKGPAFAVAALVALLATAPLVAEQRSTKPPQEVTVPLDYLPFDLKGYLRRPDGDGPFPAVILLPMCGAFVNSADHGWGDAIASWGYVVLTLDVFTARGIKADRPAFIPHLPRPPRISIEHGIGWSRRRISIENRIFVVGFGRAGTVTLSAVERDIESKPSVGFAGRLRSILLAAMRRDYEQ